MTTELPNKLEMLNRQLLFLEVLQVRLSRKDQRRLKKKKEPRDAQILFNLWFTKEWIQKQRMKLFNTLIQI